MFGLDMSGGSVVVVFLFFILAPFIINANMAKSRGKSVALIMLLTIIFSWIVTLILAFTPQVDKKS